MKEKIKSISLFCLGTALIVFVTVMVSFPFSCKISESGLHILDGDYDFPKLLEVCVEDEKSIGLRFSENVELVSHVVSCQDELVIGSSIVQDEQKNKIKVIFNNRTQIGSSYELLGTVKDYCGNTLSFSIPFLGYNDEIPKIIMTEIQTESVSSQTKLEKENQTYRNEFVEFLVLEDGNLFGLELISAIDGEERKFVFPNVKVTQGEIFLVHLRKRGNGCISEEDQNKSLAFSSYATNGIRDLWSTNEKTALGNKTDVLLVKNSFNNSVLDCFVYKESKVTEWKESCKTYLELLEDKGLIATQNNDYYFESDSKSSTKTFSRINANEVLINFKNKQNTEYPIKMNKNDWLVTKHSPGTM